ncbi:MAG: ABC transporter ATP-binding protein [Planctomycetes bacterium]|nr:ABC transporter ATP-binding protein [Planctomycetota bacterium]
MKYFLRSAKYVLPYKLRLAAALLCVVMIGVLWGSGLGVLLPAMKVLISEEGLHGWADQIIVNNRLDIATSTRQPVPSIETRAQFGYIDTVIGIADLDEDSPLATHDAGPGAWIVGADGEYLAHDALYERLARAPVGQAVTLRVYSSATGQVRDVPVVPHQAEPWWQWLYRTVTRLPRPQVPYDRFKLLAVIVLFGLTLNYVRDFFRFWQEYIVQTMTFRAVVDLRNENYDVAVRLPLSYFSLNSAADTMSRFVADCNEIRQGLVTLLGKTLVEPTKLVSTFIFALFFNWKLTLLVCIVGPPVAWVIRRLGSRIRKATRRTLESQGLMLQALEETLNGARIVKAYTTEAAEGSRFRRITRQLYRQFKSMAAADSATAPLIESLGLTAAMGAVILAGYWMYRPDDAHGGMLGWLLDNRMEPSDFLVLMGALAAMYDPVRRLSKVSVRFYNADAAAQRVFELRDQAPETDLPDAAPLDRHAESIEFRDLSFRYPGANQSALKNVSLKVWQGETVAIVGGNGSGKTTLLSMLLRLYDPTAGEVLIDGRDIARATLLSLRRQIGLVSQEAVLFNASVADNIAYGSPDATRDQVVAAARAAFADEFISRLPEGYDTVIAERGSSLSGGQRQRIAIARAILRNPAILILDEAMSQIDSESEAKIQQALNVFAEGRTTFVIAHRFSTVLSADTVVVMQDGAILDTGRHEELVTRCEAYRTLFETQLLGDR